MKIVICATSAQSDSLLHRKKRLRNGFLSAAEELCARISHLIFPTVTIEYEEGVIMGKMMAEIHQMFVCVCVCVMLLLIATLIHLKINNPIEVENSQPKFSFLFIQESEKIQMEQKIHIQNTRQQLVG